MSARSCAASNGDPAAPGGRACGEPAQLAPRRTRRDARVMGRILARVAACVAAGPHRPLCYRTAMTAPAPTPSEPADAWLAALDDAGQAIARRVVLRLVSFRDGRTEPGRPQPVSALGT